MIVEAVGQVNSFFERPDIDLVHVFALVPVALVCQHLGHTVRLLVQVGLQLGKRLLGFLSGKLRVELVVADLGELRHAHGVSFVLVLEVLL